MCPPTYLPALSSDRTWLRDGSGVDVGLAAEQWERLAALVETWIGPVELLTAEPWAPAMTFTRDLAVASDHAVIPVMAHRSRGPFEAPLLRRAMAKLDLDVRERELPQIDGGNVLADSHGRLLIGITNARPATAITAAVRALESATGRPAYRVPIQGGRYPHIDMAVCDLNGSAWLVAPSALPGFDLADPAWSALFLDRPVLTASLADSELLACNLIVNDHVAIGPEISSCLHQQLEDHGINYLATPLSELRKAGGGAHCLTLELPLTVASQQG